MLIRGLSEFLLDIYKINLFLATISCYNDQELQVIFLFYFENWQSYFGQH